MDSDSRDDWIQLKPDAEMALAELLNQLKSASSGAPSQDVLDSYLYAKRLMAETMKAFIRKDLPDRCDTFHDLRNKLWQEIERRYADRLPAAYLRVPYGSRLHEELFTVLLERIGTTVPAALLRVVTADSVHTERRIRELRELGFDIDGFTENSVDVYRLNSLEVDFSMIPALIVNRARGDKYRAMPEAEIRAFLGS